MGRCNASQKDKQHRVSSVLMYPTDECSITLPRNNTLRQSRVVKIVVSLLPLAMPCTIIDSRCAFIGAIMS